MEFLKDIVLPQPIEHFHLLLFMLNLIFILFLPFLGFLVGTAVLSAWHHRRRNHLARFFIDLPFARPGIPFYFGLLPALALLFLLAQLLQGTPAIAPGLMGFGLVFLAASMLLLHRYRYNLHLLDALREAGGGSEGASLRSSAAESAYRAGNWGVGILLVSTILMIGAVSIAVNRGSWEGVQSVAGLSLHADFWARFLQFASMSIVMTGIGTLFFGFQWEKSATALEPDAIRRMKSVAISLTALGLLAAPGLLLATQALLPAASLTGAVFGLAGTSLAAMLAAGIFFYAYHRDGREVFLTYAFFSFVVALILLFTRDQIAVRNATQDHAASLSISAERELIALRNSIGAGMKPLTGLEIYDGKCSACHMFDQKKVGPPYNVTVAKYKGDRGELARFILNPRKIDPAYPVMPGQGLKPAEADSIAAYLIARVGGGKGG